MYVIGEVISSKEIELPREVTGQPQINTCKRRAKLLDIWIAADKQFYQYVEGNVSSASE
jgi:hypothetical protein